MKAWTVHIDGLLFGESANEVRHRVMGALADDAGWTLRQAGERLLWSFRDEPEQPRGATKVYVVWTRGDEPTVDVIFATRDLAEAYVERENRRDWEREFYRPENASGQRLVERDGRTVMEYTFDQAPADWLEFDVWRRRNRDDEDWRIEEMDVREALP